MNTADYFNRMAEKWDTMFKTDTGVINHILDKADIEPDNIILDCGTGTGILIPYYAEQLTGSGWVDAYDISTGMLNKAHENMPTPTRRDSYLAISSMTRFSVPTTVS